jgi:multidrug efflux pump subunit AcrB
MARGLSPTDVSDAINAQNLVLPSGTAKIGERGIPGPDERQPGRRRGHERPADSRRERIDGAHSDVAHVRDGYAVQTNIVHRDGVRGALITVLKSGGASTIDVVNRVRAALPGILATLPPALQVDVLADQSLFVKAALNGVLVEALIAALLTASMILLFLGSWRSTLIVVLSIPLSILCSISLLGALGQTINVMTLGGLALAVGVLVDDATVGIENIHRVLEHDGTGRHRTRDPERRGSDRNSHPRVDARDLHRLRADLLSQARQRARCSSRWRWPSCLRCCRRT